MVSWRRIHFPPTATYPTQLRQGVSCLRYVLNHHQPADVILGGESAGGNLVFSVLAHLVRLHPEIERLGLALQGGRLAGRCHGSSLGFVG
ncbi:uncharacterized protein BP01DRAFT_105853 [Aspergillus saccharolyticus JOP 1030-1]|uniref:Alpha/beta hydrolase fold-3 domain-containing protein n=1 Tax=Aspergillus saccharolyticus JOP 1030-1 TaxID=1450539 RepID=A0A318Z7T0_9EURO|nr:hypothetical protein BP01DRAFT_105853 [Aspergillus saccharolyticus JOP 1030-1]PYH43236.1 hypothetical protein BP01DRAFT_105853 [Aspergillus saccharolyticus JOP 1030-1]